MHIDNWRSVALASQCLEIVSDSFQCTWHRFFLCNVDMIIVKQCFNYDWIAVTFDNYDERNGVRKFNISTSEIPQRD